MYENFTTFFAIRLTRLSLLLNLKPLTKVLELNP